MLQFSSFVWEKVEICSFCFLDSLKKGREQKNDNLISDSVCLSNTMRSVLVNKKP